MEERVQGTDGIRREVRLSSHPSVSKLSPLEAFNQKGIITEEFCELYTYSYINFLKKSGDFQEGDPIVIGWDPRDKTGSFTKSAIRGVQKAGGKPLCLGIVPTPMIPLFIADKDASGGVMITASHNPPDQNGIKLFIKGTGVKPLPFDDIQITREVLKTNYSLIRDLPLKYPEEESREEALECFNNFSIDPLNSWVDSPRSFRNMSIIVDPANGSFSRLAASLFKQAGFQVTEVSADTNGEVNRECGVVDFEGVRFIEAAESKDGGKFAHNLALREIFKRGNEYRSQVKTGERKVSGAIFDADGDRFIRLDYDPFKDRVIISSGDEIAFLQAAYLMGKEPERFRGTYYINTVESDLNASIAAERLGYTPVLTGVGDKWLLLESLLLSLEAAPGYKESVEELRKREDLSSILLSELVTATPPAPEKLRFAIGAEESGHSITTGFIKKGDQLRPLFIGNGYKSAINSFVSTEGLGLGKTPAEFYELIAEPFDPGYKKTLYIYYVKKEMVSAQSPFRKSLRSFAEDLIVGLFGKGVDLSIMKRSEEPDMLYFSVINREDGVLRAGIYIRNSGTEDKTGVNLRGSVKDKVILDKGGDALRSYLMTRIKDPEKPEFKAERFILDEILKRGETRAKDLPATIEEVSIERILREVGKQGLISSSGGTLTITEAGSLYRDNLKER